MTLPSAAESACGTFGRCPEVLGALREVSVAGVEHVDLRLDRGDLCFELLG